jgi:hypothetical protein
MVTRKILHKRKVKVGGYGKKGRASMKQKAALKKARTVRRRIRSVEQADENTYCGNNLNYSGLAAGTHQLGTREFCFKKGYRIGVRMPVDPEYRRVYNPQDARVIYCENNAANKPANQILGKLPMCLSKGVGMGKLRRARL